MTFRDAFTVIEHDYPTRAERVDALCRLLLNIGVDPDAPVENVAKWMKQAEEGRVILEAYTKALAKIERLAAILYGSSDEADRAEFADVPIPPGAP